MSKWQEQNNLENHDLDAVRNVLKKSPKLHHSKIPLKKRLASVVDLSHYNSAPSFQIVTQNIDETESKKFYQV